MSEKQLLIQVSESIGEIGGDAVIVVPLFEGDDLAALEVVRALGGDALRSALERGQATTDMYGVSVLNTGADTPALALVGAGDRDALDPIGMMRLASAASRYLTSHGFRDLAFVDRKTTSGEEFGHAVTEGAIRGLYDPGVRKTKHKTIRRLSQITLISSQTRDLIVAGTRVGQTVGEAGELARDLVNLPPNDLTPSSFASRARELADECGLGCDILDEDAMRSLGMGSLLGVAAGSAQSPRLIVLRYGDPASSTRLALVGKGITFDSGGLSLKTAEGMETMKGDMGGGAAVVAGMTAIAKLAPKNISVTGYVGATENMPGGNAMRPGDVLTAMNGETIEVLNTDAEGRLVLADLLFYASEQRATHIVDFATLTGGAVVALGHAATLATGKPSSWVEDVVAGAGYGLERAWPMPLYDDYRRAMDSDVADIKNTGGRWGSALTASAFLLDFVTAANWAHMDIAGTAWADKASAWRPAGGTGEGVGTIVGVVRLLTGS